MGWPTSLAGRVRRVEPTAFTKISTLGVEEQRVNVLIDLVSPFEVWSGLGDAYRVEARIAVFERDNATIVPAGALFRIGAEWYVYVVSLRPHIGVRCENEEVIAAFKLYVHEEARK